MEKMMMKNLTLALLLTAALGVSTADAKVKAVASFTILADLVAQVGGDGVEVTTIVGPDADAHVYEPKPDDAKAMAAADVVFVNGLGLEGFLDRLITASGFSKDIVTASKDVKPLPGEDAAPDPHAWHDIGNVKTYVKNIADGLCKADDAACPVFRENAQLYSTKLDQLDSDITANLANVPANKRIVITSHDAFSYLGHANGIRFLAPEGFSTESEASARDVANIIRQIREEKATALFVESISNPRLIEQIATETGLTVGGALYSDALSQKNGPASTYIDMMRHNTKLLTAAMAGS
jgi:zinc/manganese transport system substrate-binding protein